jgi:hypothetical protein
MVCKCFIFVDTYQKNNSTDEKSSINIKQVNRPPSYLQIYHLYLRNIIMYKRNKVSILIYNKNVVSWYCK